MVHPDSDHRPLSQVLPPLVFGTATFNNQYNKDPYALDTVGLVQQALTQGVRAFDTSPYYGPAEELLGAALDTQEVRGFISRQEYYISTKVGRIGGAEFDYSPSWIRKSIRRSLERLRMEYLDVVYCHDVEFVTQDEAVEAVKELRRIRDEEGTIKYIGCSGYPIDVLCDLAERILKETGEPLDAVMSYANYTVQNTTLKTSGVPRLKAAGVDVVPNASPLGMGLLRRDGPPVGLTDFHPAGQDLRNAIQKASDFCDSHGERIEVVAIRYALESWLSDGSIVGSLGDPASGVPWKMQSIQDFGGDKLGVSVIGVSNKQELTKTLQVWRSILDGREQGQTVADAAGRWKKAHEWSLNRQKAVQLLADEVFESLGVWLDFTWPSPPPGYTRQQRAVKEADPGHHPWLTPQTSPQSDDTGLELPERCNIGLEK